MSDNNIDEEEALLEAQFKALLKDKTKVSSEEEQEAEEEEEEEEEQNVILSFTIYILYC
jgi:hypothetical protein